MKPRTLIAAAAAGLLLAGVVVAQPYGMGPGWMGGGPFGMGPAAAGGPGPGTCLMGGPGGGGPGMMWGRGGFNHPALNLSDDQLRKMQEIQQATSKAMFEQRLQARRQMEALLTPEQRELLRR